MSCSVTRTLPSTSRSRTRCSSRSLRRSSRKRDNSIPIPASRRCSSAVSTLFCRATDCSAPRTAASSTLIPSLVAVCISTRSLINMSKTCRASSSLGGRLPPRGASTRASRARTSALVVGSELTTATMWSPGWVVVPVPAPLGNASRWACTPVPCVASASAKTRGAKGRRGVRLLITFIPAGWVDFLAQVLVAWDVGFQGLQGVGPDAGEPHKFELEQDALVGAAAAVLQAFQHHAAHVAATIVLDAGPQVDALAVGHAVVEAAHAVPLARAQAATSPLRVGWRRAKQVVQWPLPAHVKLLAGAALKPVGHADGSVVARGVACAQGSAHRLPGVGVELHRAVERPAVTPLQAATHQDVTET